MRAGTPPRLSATEHLVLDLIRATEMYGLQLVAESKGRLKRGTVYVTLGRMEEKGFIESRTDDEAAHSGMPRKLYRATALGARLLDAWSLMAASVMGARRHA
jgi:PadR family transcriptional regulator, regulatory protein PadR